MLVILSSVGMIYAINPPTSAILVENNGEITVAFLPVTMSYPQTPDLDGHSFKSDDGTYYDFTSTGVIYTYQSIQRNCEWRIKYDGKYFRKATGNRDLYTWKIYIDMPMSYGIKTLTGTFQALENGEIYGGMTIEGYKYKKIL